MIREERSVRRRSLLSAKGAKSAQDRRNGRVARRNEDCRKNEKRKSSAGKKSVSRKNGMTLEARMMIMTVTVGIGMLMSGVAIATTGVMMNMTGWS